jgi:hypothetical protein
MARRRRRRAAKTRSGTRHDSATRDPSLEEETKLMAVMQVA